MGRINFYFEAVPRIVIYQNKLKEIIHQVTQRENGGIGEINVVFCCDSYLLEINKSFLNHDFFTDIVTFDYSADKIVSGELYVSIDRVKENALIYNQKFKVELVRVILHGVLHLLGYGDHSDEEKAIMRSREDKYLSLFQIENLY